MNVAATPPTETETRKPINRRWAAAAFTLSSAVTVSLTVIGGYATQALEARHVDRKADYDRFGELARKTDGAMTGFMNVYLLTAPVDGEGRARKALPLNDTTLVARRKSLEDSLQEQDGALDEIALGLSPSDSRTVVRYREQMGSIYEALEKPVPVQDAKAFVQAAATAQDTRDDLLAVLKRRAHRFFF